MRRTVWLAPLVVLVAACGGSASSGSAAKTTTVQRVVTEQQPASGNASSSAPVPSERPAGFDPGAIYKREAPGVVTVISVFEGQSLGSLLGGGGGGGGQQAGQGSGFVINADGEIATNAHVVTNGQGAQLKRAQQVYVKFADGNQVSARIVGADPNVDVALIKVDPKGLTLRPLPLGDSIKGVEVGQPVAAIGSPFGEPQSLSVGVISGLNRNIDSLAKDFQISGAIQTDAAINHGNSGGPLVNSSGQVLGINAQIQSTGGGGEGVGFAVPVDSVRRSLDALRKKGTARYAYLGVSTVQVYPQLAARFGLPVRQGAWVQEARPGAPAVKAGIKGGSRTQTRFQFRPFNNGGDIIIAADGQQLTHDGDLSRIVGLHPPGERIRLDVRSESGKARTVTVVLGTRPGTG